MWMISTGGLLFMVLPTRAGSDCGSMSVEQVGILLI
jgi:hypothetical protein